MTDVSTTAAELVEEFDEHLDLDGEEVEEKLNGLVDEFRLPIDEAKRTVRNAYMEEAGIEQTDGAIPPNVEDSEFDPTPIDDINEENEWHDIRAKLIQLWEPNSEDMEQVGLLGDESGVIKFTLWKDTNLPALEKGTTYHIKNVVTDEYKGRYSVKFVKASAIAAAEDDTIENGGDDTTMSGCLVDIQSGSGLIKRCDEEDCTRVLNNGRCAEHGEMDGEFDLRIKGVLDDGHTAQKVVFNEEHTTKATGINLEQARDDAMDALDTKVVAQAMEAEVLGKYYEITGPILGEYLVVNEAEELTGVPDDVAASLEERIDSAAETDPDAAQSEASA